MSNIPKDPDMLYSYINMMLRDEFDTLEGLCVSKDIPIAEIKEKLSEAGYEYDEETNRFL